MKLEANRLRLSIIRRRLFIALAVLSLLLCTATLALWVRSHGRLEALGTGYWGHDDQHFKTRLLQSTQGQLIVVNADTLRPSRAWGSLAQPGWHYYTSRPRGPLSSGGIVMTFVRANSPTRTSSGWLFGFGYFFADMQGRPLRAFAIPHWFLALLFAIIPAWWLVSTIRSHRRHRIGLCPVCGYDLRATPERCPECGTANATTETQRHGD